MTEFFIYQGKAAIALAVFYMFYRLLLSKETFHRFNRIVLLGTAALSFVLPLCVITLKEVVVVPAMTFIYVISFRDVIPESIGNHYCTFSICSISSFSSSTVIFSSFTSVDTALRYELLK